MIKDNQKVFNRLLVVIDAVITGISFILSYFIKFYILEKGPGIGVLPVREYVNLLFFLVPGYMFLYSQSGVYAPKRTVRKRFDIYGIKDIWNYKVEPSEVLEKIQYPTLFLSHNPDIFPKVPKEISLTLSGHTHGGEISLPLLGAPLIPSIYAHKYAKGHIIENNKHLYVTSGIATTSGFRTFNSPEIIVLNLYDN